MMHKSIQFKNPSLPFDQISQGWIEAWIDATGTYYE